MLDFVNLCHGLRIGGVAADAPYRVGGVENDAAFIQNLDGILNIFFLCHNYIAISGQRYEKIYRCTKTL